MSSNLLSFYEYLTNSIKSNPYLKNTVDNSRNITENTRITFKNDDIEKFDFDKKFDDIEELIEYYFRLYPEQFYMQFPEYTVYKLNLSTTILNSLPSVDKRTRSDIKKWMTESNLSLEQFVSVGF